jgi:hypothetical protein
MHSALKKLASRFFHGNAGILMRHESIRRASTKHYFLQWETWVFNSKFGWFANPQFSEIFPKFLD